MFFDQREQTIKVFVADVGHDMQEGKLQLLAVLDSAGMLVVPAPGPGDNAPLQADCSLHLLGLESSPASSAHLALANRTRTRDEHFKIFIWQHPGLAVEHGSEQEAFLNTVRNNIYQNTFFSRQESFIMLAEDIRTIMLEEKKDTLNVTRTDIFFIYNEVDDDAAKAITDMIRDIASVKSLSIALNNPVDYASIVTDQMEQALLTVIFFKRTAPWALPFAQQVWKNTGGASSNAKILLLGDANHEQNARAQFEASNVTSMLVAGELIPIEIKVQFDKLTYPGE